MIIIHGRNGGTGMVRLWTDDMASYGQFGCAEVATVNVLLQCSRQCGIDMGIRWHHSDCDGVDHTCRCAVLTHIPRLE